MAPWNDNVVVFGRALMRARSVVPLSAALVLITAAPAFAAPSSTPKPTASAKVSVSSSASASASASTTSTATTTAANGVAPQPKPTGKPVVVWADSTRAAVLAAQFPQGFGGHPLQVVTKDLSTLQTDLAAASAATAPDVVEMQGEWTGALADAGLIVPLNVPTALAAQFPANVLATFHYGVSTFGIPVQFENVALITNTKVIKVAPPTFASLVVKVQKQLKAGVITTGLAVGQGTTGNAYNMQPLFAGLGGYIFGSAPKGAVDVHNLGIQNPMFVQNQPKIDAWNAAKVVDSTLTTDAAKAAFTTGKAAFWITGPWDAPTLASLKFTYQVSPVPNIVPGFATSPFIGSKGFAATKFAAKHGLTAVTKSFLRKGLTAAGVQAAFGAAAGRMPAVLSAAPASTLIKAFGVAATDGIALPTVPQMSQVWAPLGQAWASSTSGSAATPAATSFAAAAAAVSTAVGGATAGPAPTPSGVSASPSPSASGSASGSIKPSPSVTPTPVVTVTVTATPTKKPGAKPTRTSKR